MPWQNWTAIEATPVGDGRSSKCLRYLYHSLNLIHVSRIFIVEGILTIVVAVASKWLLADWPEQAKFLTEGERALLLAKLSRSEGVAKMDRLDRDALRRILQDWKIWTGYDDRCHEYFN